MKKIGVSYPILLPSKTIAKDYKLGDYLPETFIVNQRDDRHDPNETLDRRHLTIDRKGGLPATR